MKLLLAILFLSTSLAIGGAVPFTILETGSFRDGGTVFCKLKSDQGEIIEMCIDRRPNSETYLELFIGALHPNYKGARVAPESTRKKLVTLITELMSLEPEKYSGFTKVLAEHKKRKQNKSVDSTPGS